MFASFLENEDLSLKPGSNPLPIQDAGADSLNGGFLPGTNANWKEGGGAAPKDTLRSEVDETHHDVLVLPLVLPDSKLGSGFITESPWADQMSTFDIAGTVNLSIIHTPAKQWMLYFPIIGWVRYFTGMSSNSQWAVRIPVPHILATLKIESMKDAEHLQETGGWVEQTFTTNREENPEVFNDVVFSRLQKGSLEMKVRYQPT